MDNIGKIPVMIYNKFKELFILLFIPADGFLSERFSDLGNVFNKKFPIIQTGTTLFTSFKNNLTGLDSTAPVFTYKYGGKTYTFFDASVLDPYIVNIRIFLSIILWGTFILTFFKQLPRVIHK